MDILAALLIVLALLGAIAGAAAVESRDGYESRRY